MIDVNFSPRVRPAQGLSGLRFRAEADEMVEKYLRDKRPHLFIARDCTFLRSVMVGLIVYYSSPKL